MRKSVVKVIVVFAMVIWTAVTAIAVTSGRTGSSVKPAVFPQVHPNVFFDARYFPTENKYKRPAGEAQIYGAVVPHHLLAGELIGEVFSRLQVQKPRTIILIGPNHLNQSGSVLTSDLGWETPFGVVNVDINMIERLCLETRMKKDNGVCGAEHSLGSIMPFIKYYLPEAKVVPIILHHNVSLEEANSLGTVLAQMTGKDTIIIASVDFSHYLNRREAQEKDRETLDAMTKGNMGRLFTMGNEHLDSPASLGVLFSAMKSLGQESIQVINNTNSGELLGNDLIETTSYFTFVFRK